VIRKKQRIVCSYGCSTYILVLKIVNVPASRYLCQGTEIKRARKPCPELRHTRSPVKPYPLCRSIPIKR